MSIKSQIKLVKFLLKYPSKWPSFANNYQTVSIVCATSNLKILQVNDYGQMRLCSVENANMFLGKYRG